MVQVSKIVGFGIMCLFTLLLPIGFVLYGVIKKNKGFPLTPLLWGILSFFISQVILRLPLMQFAARTEWYGPFVSTLVGIIVVGGLSAGLFEESARLILGCTAMKKHMNWRDVLVFGLGHGLCEVVFLVGALYLNNFYYSILINQNLAMNALSGQASGEMALIFPGVLAMDSTVIAGLVEQLNGIQWWQMVMALLERVISVVFHISMTVLVFRGLQRVRGRVAWLGWYLLAILFHTITNTVSVLTAAKSMVLSEVVLLIMVVPLAWLAYKQKEYFPESIKSGIRRGRRPR